MRTLFVITFLIFISGAVAACAKDAGGPVTYPSGWPYPEIKAPSSCTRVKLPDMYQSSSHDGYMVDGATTYDGSKQYAVAFKFTGIWDDLYNSINKSAVDAGFKELKGHPNVFTWYEKDKKTTADSNEVRMELFGDECYLLKISTH